MNSERIRNFCIIAHIDHGKSTLADRFLEVTGTIDKRELKEQTLDTMDIERERGITIKLQPARMTWEYVPVVENVLDVQIENEGRTKQHLEQAKRSNSSNNNQYILNLIDTPGHVDFSYEVSRSLAAVEGALLIVDASQGIEAQTLSTLYAAVEADLTIIPVINKIDLPHADPEKVAQEIIGLLGCKKEEIILASGKTGQGVEQILDSIIERIPAPGIITDSGTRALIFDSFYDSYKGVMIYVRVFEGEIKKGDKLILMAEHNSADVIEIGCLKPKTIPLNQLTAGEIGYIVTGLKETSKARVGDTVTVPKKEANEPLPGYKKIKPFVYAGVYTTVGDDFPLLREALEKLSLSDSSLQYEPEKSQALGFGFRCGFLGLLHLEIVKERLEREFNLSLITTSPSVSYEIKKTNGDILTISSPADLPEKTEIAEIREPFTRLEIVTPSTTSEILWS
jgi:GTP-binding protein LepA